MPFVTVDDSDLSQISYYGKWFRGGGSPEWLNTTHGSSTAGVTATFKFNGTSLMVYGTVPAATKGNTAISSFQMDYSSPVVVTAPVTNTIQYHEILYRSPWLQDTEHTLLIRMLGQGAFTFWLDYIRYETADNSTVSTSSQAPPASKTASLAMSSFVSTSSSSTSGSPSVGSNVATPTNTSISADSPSKSNLPAILAAVFIPLFVIIFVLLGLFWWRKYRGEHRQYRHFLLEDEPGVQTACLPPHAQVVDPYLKHTQPLSHLDRGGPMGPTPETSEASVVRGLTLSNPDTRARSDMSSVPAHGEDLSLISLSPASTQRRKERAPPPARQPTYRQHDDGGVRLAAAVDRQSDEIVDLPPAYRQY